MCLPVVVFSLYAHNAKLHVFMYFMRYFIFLLIFFWKFSLTFTEWSNSSEEYLSLIPHSLFSPWPILLMKLSTKVFFLHLIFHFQRHFHLGFIQQFCLHSMCWIDYLISFTSLFLFSCSRFMSSLNFFKILVTTFYSLCLVVLPTCFH